MTMKKRKSKEKKWELDPVRSRCGKEKYPREGMKHFEGNHIGMHKRMWSKSNAGCVDVYHHTPWIPSKYVIGLLNKFVGKPFTKFEEVWINKTKTIFKKYGTYLSEILDDYIVIKDKPQQRKKYYQNFYVDKSGLIKRIVKPPKRKSQWSIDKWKYNTRVHIPSFGEARVSADGPLLQQFRKPLLLGEFYVEISGKVIKLPVYTCAGIYFIERYYDFYYNRPKKKEEDPTWIPVRVNGMDSYQSYFVREENKTLTKLEESLNTELLKDNPDTATVNSLREKIQITPEYAVYDLGYGTFHTYVKRKDYENYGK
jgi:hypothetical protein